MSSRLNTRPASAEDVLADEALREMCGATFPGMPIALVVALTVAAAVVAVGVRAGWAWGAAAGFVAWVVSGLVVLCAGLATGGNRDAEE
jgi:hypothetical protein